MNPTAKRYRELAVQFRNYAAGTTGETARILLELASANEARADVLSGKIKQPEKPKAPRKGTGRAGKNSPFPDAER